MGPPDMFRVPPRLLVAGGLLAALLVCFWPLARHPADLLVGVQRNGLNDLTGYYVGNRDYPRQCLLKYGQLPFWNPSTCGGAPYLGNPQAAVFYPPNWLFWVFGAPALISGFLVGHHLIAGVGAYGLARQLGGSRLGGLFGGIAYLASPVLLARTGEGHLGSLGALAWAPWAFWMYERYRVEARRVRLGLAVVLALAILAGHIQEAYYLILVLTGFCLWDAFRLSRSGRGAEAGALLLRWPAVGLVTAGLTLAELFPMSLFARHSARGAGLFSGISAASSAGPANLLQLFAPFALGGPTTYQGPGTYFWESLCHFGLVPVILAYLGLLAGLRDRRPVGRMAVVGGLALVFAFGGATPLYPFLQRVIPGIALFRFPSRALFLPALAVAVLGGFGLDAIAAAALDRGRRLRADLMTGVPGLIVMAAVLFWTGKLGLRPYLSSPSGSPWSLALKATLNHPAFWLCSAATLAIAVVAAVRPKRSVALAVLLVPLGTVELAGFAQAILRTVPSGSLRSSAPFDRALKSEGTGARVLARQLALSDREAVAHSFLKVEGYDPIPLTRTFAFMSAVELDASPIQGIFGIKPIDLSGSSKRLLDLFGVRHAVLLKSDSVPPGGEWTLVDTGQVAELVALRDAPPRLLEYRRLENASALPRGFVVGRARLLQPGEDYKAALAALDPRREVLLERDVLAPGARQEFTPARLVEDTPNRVVLEVETTRPGYLVLTDSGYPGWKAVVDGRPVPIFPAHIAFRAVALSAAGTHRIVFHYHPVGTSLCALVSALTVLGLVWTAWPSSTDELPAATPEPTES